MFSMGGGGRRGPTRSSGRYEFVIWAPSFDPDSGGGIALHALCHRLNQAGVRAALWPDLKPVPRAPFGWPSLKSLVGYVVKRNYRFDRGPFANPIAGLRDLTGAVVVYPEVIAGNPLRSRRVVRWLLHRPGFHTGESHYGSDDLFFFYQHGFDDPNYNQDPTNRLTVTWVNEAYRDLGLPNRGGKCYLLRKGAERANEQDLSDGIVIDGLGHGEMSGVFNRSSRMYSYDLYTLYNVYAAMCGCVPVIVPEPGVSKEEWLPKAEDRFGLAYGEDEIPWAIRTRDDLLARFRKVREEEEGMLVAFVEKCRRRFGCS